MLVLRAFLVIGLLGCMTFQVPEADAQGGAVANCAKAAKAIWENVGKPFIRGVAQRGGALWIEEHFAKRLQKGGTITIKKDDIEWLLQESERRGMPECELNRQLEAMSGQYAAPIGYSAQAHCGRTGVTGMAQGQPTREHALKMAIQDCINRGGIPHCCEQGASLTW